MESTLRRWWTILLVIVAAQHADAASAQLAPNWQEIGRLTIDGKSSAALANFPDNEERSLQVRLQADKDVTLDQVDISYASGRVDYVREAVALRKDTPSIALATRATGVIVQTLTVRSGEFVAKGPITIKVLGDVVPTPAGQSNIAEDKRSATSQNKFGTLAAKTYEEIGLHYATTRAREADRTKNGQVIVSFSGEPASTTTMGYAVVTVPKERPRGTIPRPIADLVLRFRKEDPAKEFTLASITSMPEPNFQMSVGNQAASGYKFKGQAFVFIHGFNVTFDDALYHAAQIVHDTEYDGAAIVFSWPSRGNLLSYVYDRERARPSASALRDLLGSLGKNPDIETVNVVAHSMGNEPLVEVLKEQAAINRAGGNVLPMKLGEVIFAAPDVGSDAFSQLKEALGPLVKGGGTLYASEKDLALGFSGSVANPIDRAGYVLRGKSPLIVKGIESIDMTKASWFFSLNHSTFSDRQLLLADISALFEKRVHPPSQRSPIFLELRTELGPYWKVD